MVIVFMLLLPSVVVANESESEIFETQNKEGKPDLYVQWIEPDTGDVPLITGTVCLIRNRGDAPASGEIAVRLVVWEAIFGIFPIIKECDEISSFTDSSFTPSERRYVYFSYMPEERFHFYRFTAYVDCYGSVDESDEDNNSRTERTFIFDIEDAFFGWWDF